jgi:hypothetical protein
MKYLLLLHVPSDLREREAVRAPIDVWNAFTAELSESGALLGWDALQGQEAATTVRERDGERVVTDGPFAETKEMLGGYYLIDVPDLDAALAWAAKVPNAPYGSVEVRPIMEFDTP